MADEIDKESLGRYVELQGQTPCRKCKAKDWTLREGFRMADGGERVGIFVVLGPKTDRVAVVTFECQKCKATFDRPVYSREQLAKQEFPAVNLDAKLEKQDPEAKAKKNGSAP